MSSCHIIRKIRLAHCKRGPEVCEKCREMDVERICLLDISPPDAGLVQRRVIEVTIEGEKAWREFDVVRAFADEEEAAAYAAQNGIEDVVI
ncbi:MAG: hypothetical protein JW918_11010 [Anaerolineae bacterium]|nr:hypothetical protein [Anaerolineae bacterium]